jgi:hypothetical protein
MGGSFASCPQFSADAAKATSAVTRDLMRENYGASRRSTQIRAATYIGRALEVRERTGRLEFILLGALAVVVFGTLISRIAQPGLPVRCRENARRG